MQIRHIAILILVSFLCIFFLGGAWWSVQYVEQVKEMGMYTNFQLRTEVGLIMMRAMATVAVACFCLMMALATMIKFDII